MKVKEISNNDLIYPLITRTVPPPLNYYGSIENYDYFSIHCNKYKVFKSNMNDKYKFKFISWDKKNKVAMTIEILELIPKNEKDLKKEDRLKINDIDEQGRPMGGFRH